MMIYPQINNIFNWRGASCGPSATVESVVRET